MSGNGVSIAGRGYYDVQANVIAAPTVAGTITTALYKDGVAVAGATASVTVETAGDTVTLPICAMIREKCCEAESTLTLVTGGVSANISNVAVKVEKI